MFVFLFEHGKLRSIIMIGGKNVRNSSACSNNRMNTSSFAHIFYAQWGIDVHGELEVERGAFAVVADVVVAGIVEDVQSFLIFSAFILKYKKICTISTRIVNATFTERY